MTRNLKALGLALVAMLALGAVVASAASAESTPSEKFTASQTPVTIEGGSAAGVEEFETEAGVVKCASTFEATVSVSTSNEITVTPDYSSCQAFGFLSATVNENGCDYTFKLKTKGAFGGTVAYQANVDVFECTSPTGIQIIAVSCEAYVEPQVSLATVDIHSMGASDGSGLSDITVKPTVSNIAYEITKDGAGCPFNPIKVPETKSNGIYRSSSYITLRGYAHSGSTGAQVAIDIG